MDVQLTENSISDVCDRLRALPADVQLKGARFAGRKAANIIADAARSNAERLDDPTTAESIAKNIDVRFATKTFRRTGNPAFRIGVLGGAQQYANTRANKRKGRVGSAYKTAGDKSNPGGDTWYWRQLEFGNKNAAPKPVLRAAMQQHADTAVGVFAVELSRWIDNYIKRQAKLRG